MSDQVERDLLIGGLWFLWPPCLGREELCLVFGLCCLIFSLDLDRGKGLALEVDLAELPLNSLCLELARPRWVISEFSIIPVLPLPFTGDSSYRFDLDLDNLFSR